MNLNILQFLSAWAWAPAHTAHTRYELHDLWLCSTVYAYEYISRPSAQGTDTCSGYFVFVFAPKHSEVQVFRYFRIEMIVCHHFCIVAAATIRPDKFKHESLLKTRAKNIVALMLRKV